MDSLKDIIQDCHQQRKKSLRQRKTIVTPALYKGYPYHFTIHCARGYRVRLHDLEQADISFMPIGHAPESDHPPRDFGGERFLKRQVTQDWIRRQWFESWGIHVYTGIPSAREGAQWHDINFKYDAICAAPDAVFACIEKLIDSVVNPLLTLTKSGGLRFSCRVPDYLHPNTKQERQYIHKYRPTPDNPHHRDIYLEILGDKGHNCWDGRHEILLGALLDPPVIMKDVLFAPIDTLRNALHEPAPSLEETSEVTFQSVIVSPPVSDPVNEKVIAIREGKLSPLAIKRPSPVLHKAAYKDSSPRFPALRVLEHNEKTGQLCAVNEAGTRLQFLEVSISKDVLDAWDIQYQGSTLGNFAKALLNALENKRHVEDGKVVTRVHTVIEAFEGQEEILVRQMDTENVNQTLWHQLKRFFQHYQRDVDAPMMWDASAMRFWVPSTLNDTFPDEKIDVNRVEPTAWLAGNRVFQIRTGIYSVHDILNYENSWDDLGLSVTGQRFFSGIRAEIERDPNVQHILICNHRAAEQVADLTSKENVRFLRHIKRAADVEVLQSEFELADVIWIVGAPYWPPHLMWKQAQILLGNDTEPLCYDVEFKPYRYEDERIQALCEQNIVGILTQIIRQAGLDRAENKTVVLLTGMSLPEITSRPETLLFDWEDFEIADRLDKLAETITTRQRFEEERANLTAESHREKVVEVLGVSKSQANRILTKLRGGKRPTMHEQIHTLLESGDKKTAELVSAIEGHPNAIKNELKRLVDTGEIVKVRRAVYTLPPSISS